MVEWAEISRWWPLLLVVVPIAVAWGKERQRVSDLCDKISSLQAKIDANTIDRLALEARLSRIETDLAFIRAILEKKP